MKKIIDKKTGETFMGEVWIAKIEDGKRELKVELKTGDDVNRYRFEDAPEEKKYGGRVPKEGDAFWFVTADGSVRTMMWEGAKWDMDRFEAGSAFWTREEAERELARRKAYVILKEDTKGFKPNWNLSSTLKYTVFYNHVVRELDINEYSRLQSLPNDLIFATEEDVQASIEAHSSEWKTWLGVEE